MIESEMKRKWNVMILIFRIVWFMKNNIINIVFSEYSKEKRDEENIKGKPKDLHPNSIIANKEVRMKDDLLKLNRITVHEKKIREKSKEEKRYKRRERRREYDRKWNKENEIKKREKMFIKWKGRKSRKGRT